MTTEPDIRFDVPLYTVAEAARHLGTPERSFRNWATGYVAGSSGGAPLLTTVRTRGRGPVIPFVGLVEGLVLGAFRRTGIPMQRIRPAIDKLNAELGVPHALASQRLYTDDAEIVRDEAPIGAGDKRLVVVRNGQHVFAPVVQSHLKLMSFGTDGWPAGVTLPGVEDGYAMADPSRGFGQPIFTQAGVGVEDVMDAFASGEDLATISQEFGVEQKAIEAALRSRTRAA